MPLLSVIIPVYNAARYLRRCIESVQEQGIDDLQILCVDDGSTDESPALLAELARADSRIEILTQPHASAGAARNLGMTRAEGKWLHFLDADDFLELGLYETGIRQLEKTGADVWMFQYWLLDETTGQEKRCPCMLDGPERVTTLLDEPAFFLYNSVVPWNKLYRRDWVAEQGLRFDEITCANDRAFYFKMLAAGPQIAIGRDYGLHYRTQNAGALTGTGRAKNFDCLSYAWQSAAKAMEGLPEAVRAMHLDVTGEDYLSVFRSAPEALKEPVFGQLKAALAALDEKTLAALPTPCLWQGAAEAVRRAEGWQECSLPAESRRMKLQKMLRIWGLKGCAVKARAARGG